MKINAADFLEFVRKATLDSSILSFTLTIDENGFYCNTRDLGNVTLVSAENKKWVSKEKMVLPIKNTKMLKDSLKLFRGTIEIKKENNIFSLFNDERQVDIVLASEEFIENSLPKGAGPKYEVSDALINSIVFKNVVKSAAIVESNEYQLHFTGEKLIVEVGDAEFDNIKETANCKYDKCDVKVGEMFEKIVAVIDENIKVAAKSDYPLRITETIQTGTYTYIIAPMVKNEESAE